MPVNDDSKVHPWISKGSRIISENRIFTLKTETFTSPKTGLDHDFYLLEAGDWANIIPLTKDREVLLVKQFRHGTNRMSLEIPGGMVDPGETPEQAGARELIEETGYKGSEIIPLGRVEPNPALFNNYCHTYLAKDVIPVAPGAPTKLDGTEDIELVKVNLDQIPGLIAQEKIVHALVIAAFYHYFMTYAPTQGGKKNV
ncbi:MAG: NUDIX hydrolase [Deltaproteobacteria bacterium]|nr:NUDIX hydrolase [Deltaproteobacteria bacterium]MBW2051093.1 NUDIX hydrolase [Deltaproteobacteria bacterium]MBW2140302.1 NUDIX hydrolase [Deltaproteobacteria bacterium]MBW2322907.1 NUDIX hydrolase [Deltaproteobacteria bacterium]